MKTQRLESADGLRGLACLYVVLYHVFLLWPVSSHLPGSTVVTQLLTRVAAYGHIGVDIFLVLSGFVLFYPSCRKAGLGAHSLSLPSIGMYARRRTRRILPPYLVALGMFSVLPLWSLWSTYVAPIPTPVEVVSHLVLIHNLFPSTILRIDGPLWSLALEAQLYVAFPLLVLLFRRIGPIPFLLVMFSASAIFRFIAWGPLGVSSGSLETQFVAMASLPGRISEFSAGMLAAFVVTRQHSPWQRRLIGLSAITIVLVAAVLAYVTDKHFGEHSPVPALMWGILGAALLAGCCAVRSLERLLGWKPFVRLGLISYSVYLIHEPLLRLSGGLVGQIGLTPTAALLTFVFIGAPVILGISVVFWYVFERPFVTRVQVGPKASKTRLADRLPVRASESAPLVSSGSGSA